MANKGIPIEIAPCKDNKGYPLAQLIDVYGLDIRCLKRGVWKHPGRWVLAGEWHGRHYVDYIAQRLAEHEARK
jgi:hypothetical protein